MFLDGEHFLKSLRNIFPYEFNREDYLPRQARWTLFFSSIASILRAKTAMAYWYTISELDYVPDVDWGAISNEECEYRFRKFEWAERKLNEVHPAKDRRQLVEEFRHQFMEKRQRMRTRLKEWHQLQDDAAKACPFLAFRRTGWQACQLENLHLQHEKGIDIGLAVDMALMEKYYDTALIFSGDGDFVPAVKAMQARGKIVGRVEFGTRDGRIYRSAAKRLRHAADFVLEVPFEDLAIFMGIATGLEGNRTLAE